MIRGTLTRVESSPQGTFGRLILPGFAAFTGELPCLDNIPNISCVQTGTYAAQLTYSPRFGRQLYLIGQVPRRSGIRIHSANFMGDARLGYRKQLSGCIALGDRLGWMDGQKAILLSAPAVRRLHTVMRNQPFILEIKNA